MYNPPSLFDKGLFNGGVALLSFWMYGRVQERPARMRDKLTEDLLFAGGYINAVIAVASFIAHIRKK